eukprot:TRINITY_DN37593_c0_g1_i1.p1 TRINITY_DN37593_c0_g1~~TRINITY_DN37593_c0_g1_i1.p1  ORF type:complete len:509 (+),score=83.37 TRINITY_DN37593_c0_g1_i1:80-1606(+)
MSESSGLETILGAAILIFALQLVKWYLASLRKQKEIEELGKYSDRAFLHQADLLDPKIRSDHLSFNRHLHQTFEGKRFVPVRGEDGCLIAFSHGVCKEAMNDHSSFSSNPFPDDRLVALNTMTKADHQRVLRYVHSFYMQAGIEEIQERMRSIIRRCTDELVAAGEAGDVVLWAKRVHMSSTLARFGIPVEVDETWDRVDELVKLNDAMVALVAPLGGIGKGYETLSTFWFFGLIWGLICSFVPLLLMASKLGILCTWQIIRPDVTVLFPASKPRMGLWWRPDLLQLVPYYFMSLNRILFEEALSEESKGPLQGIREGIKKGDLTLAESLTLLVQLMVNMTSANALCSMVFRLASEKEASDQLRSSSSDDLCEAFVKEVLRLDAPLQRNPRRCVNIGKKWTGDADAEDVGLKAGDQILLFIGAANMDPAVYQTPDKFRLDRVDEPVALSFGSGMHYCLGKNLVEIEMKMALKHLLEFKSLKLVDGEERLCDVDVGNWGFRRLPVHLQH